jgi:hypothetical protein
VAKLRSDFALPLGARNGIAAESPQDLHWQIRGLGAESPVFLGGRSAPKKMRPESEFLCVYPADKGV